MACPKKRITLSKKKKKAHYFSNQLLFSFKSIKNLNSCIFCYNKKLLTFNKKCQQNKCMCVTTTLLYGEIA